MKKNNNQKKQNIIKLFNDLTYEDEEWEFIELINTILKQNNNKKDCLLSLIDNLKHKEILLETLKAINKERDLKKLLNLIIDKAIEITQAERGFVILENITIGRNYDKEDILKNYKISSSIIKEIKKKKITLLINNAQIHEKFSRIKSVKENKLLSILCSPIILEDKVVGVIYVDNRLVKNRFRKSHIKLLDIFSQQCAISIYNAKINEKLLEKSKKLEELNKNLHKKIKSQTQEIVLIKKELKSIKKEQESYHDLKGKSKEIKKIYEIIKKVKDYQIPILIEGESGTGKELIAKALHYTSNRKDKPFISENCSAIPESLFESEFFGYEKGAYTGALESKKGLLELAKEGTLFLDEIGELSLEIQKKLLRVLEEKKFRRVGGKDLIEIGNIRIISATNKNLSQLIKEGKFREDLYYRLKCIYIKVPPLRDRKEDILLLIEHFFKEAKKKINKKDLKIDSKVLDILVNYYWPGNIRELRNEIFKLTAISENEIKIENLSPEIYSTKYKSKEIKEGINLPLLIQDIEKEEILKALKKVNYNKVKASQLLGITRFTLARKMEKLNIKI